MTTINKTHVLIAMIAATPPTITSIASAVLASQAAAKMEAVAVKVEEVRHATNSMKDALVAGATREGVTKGIKQGRIEGTSEEKSRAARAKENQAKGAADEKAKPWFKK